MSLINDYSIPFYGLKEGKYEYDFTAGDEFFALFDNTEIHGGELSIRLGLIRKSQLLELDFRITGKLNITCDRCTSPFDFAIESRNILFVRLGESFEELSDEIIVIPSGETRFNVAQYIYEYSVLSLPLQRTHPDTPEGVSGCDPEMLEHLYNLSGSEEENDEEGTDPRWEELKKLKFKS